MVLVADIYSASWEYVAPPGGLEPPTVCLEGRFEPSHSVTTSGKLSHIAWSQGVLAPMDSMRPNETGMLGLLLGRAERAKRPWGAVHRPAWPQERPAHGSQDHQVATTSSSIWSLPD